MAANAGEDFSRLGQRMATAGEDFSQFDISKEEMEKLVAEVVRYVIFKTHHSSGCPIKREELVQLVTKNYFHRNLPALVINAAKDKLSSVFGYELRELQTSRPSSANLGRPSQNSVADPKSYNLVSQLPPEVYKKYVEDENTAHLTGFMFVIVSIVHLAEGKIPVENLWHHLKRMGLCENEISLPLFGNIKQALETVVQQRLALPDMVDSVFAVPFICNNFLHWTESRQLFLLYFCKYLQEDKVNSPEGNTMFFELAERALDAPVREKIKEYVSQ